MLVFGDVASGFVESPDGASQDGMNDGARDIEVPTPVAEVSLPDVAMALSRGNFVAAIRISEIDAKDNLVGFQGDLTFDERAVTFEEPPVQNAGLTAGNWNGRARQGAAI